MYGLCKPDPLELLDKYGPTPKGLLISGLGMGGKFLTNGEFKPSGLFTSGEGILGVLSDEKLPFIYPPRA